MVAAFEFILFTERKQGSLLMIPDIKPELQQLTQAISTKPMYRGSKIPASVMAMFEIHETQSSCGLLVPAWFSVFENGRGPWRGTNIGNPLLRVKIYNWMKKRNLFRSSTEAGKRGEAFVIARHINKFGNEQYRNHIHIDVYTTEREKTIKEIDQKFSVLINKITKEVI